MSDWLKEAFAVAGVLTLLAFIMFFADREGQPEEPEYDEPQVLDEDDLE